MATSVILDSAIHLIQRLAAHFRSPNSSTDLTPPDQENGSAAAAKLADGMEKLRLMMLRIQATLDDAEDREITDESVQRWLSNLKHLARDSEDLLAYFDFEVLRSKIEDDCDGNDDEGEEWRMNNNSRSAPPFDAAASMRNMEHIKRRFEDISKEREKLLLQEGGEQRRVRSNVDRGFLLEEIPTVAEEVAQTIVGREDEKEKIVQVLCSGETAGAGTRNVYAIAIVGMGGLGKSTLAELVYHDQRIVGHFEKRMWVADSDGSEVESIMRKAITLGSNQMCEGVGSLDLLQQMLRRVVEHKKFLLVLDDMWSVSRPRWEAIWAPLTAGTRGSRVLVTTRSDEVVRMMMGDMMSLYRPSCLSREDSWVLLRQLAFGKGNSAPSRRVEELGIEIANKMQGLPLSIRMIGGLLLFCTNEKEWEHVLESEIWDLPEAEDGKHSVLPALRLSYHHLPSTLKRCFLYCATLPKGSVLNKGNMILCWMAQGYVQSRSRKYMEDTAADYFNDLVSRSFFRYCKFLEQDYVMHDAIHYLARSVYDDTRKRSLEVHGKDVRLNHDFFIGMESLRVLDLSGVGIAELPSSICNLKQLRFLCLKNTKIMQLPESICGLYNLQTLHLLGSLILVPPRGMSRLVNLRHLEAPSELVTGITRIGRLTCLQGLLKFKVRRERGYKIDELQDLNNLHGELYIAGIRNVFSAEEAMKAKLNYKPHLQELNLVWNEEDEEEKEEDEEEKEEEEEEEGAAIADMVLEGLQPHANIKLVAVASYPGLSFPPWVQSLTRLEKLFLVNCKRCQLIPQIRNLPLLKFVDIRGLDRLERVGGGSQPLSGKEGNKGFPCLQQLILYDLPELVEWSGLEDDEFPCLQKLVVYCCPKLKGLDSLTRLTTLTVLQIQGPGEMQITSIPRMPSLAVLGIYSFSSITVLPHDFLQGLTLLEVLTFGYCDKLTSLAEAGLEQLTSLRSLKLEHCPALVSLPDGRLLNGLKELAVVSCPRLLNWLGSLHSLQTLDIRGHPHLESIPEDVLPNNLMSLSIGDCHNLLNLPSGLQRLTSLTSLEVHNCPHVQFASGDQRLPPRLRRLSVWYCPMLEEQFQREGRQDWPVVAHVSHMNFNYRLYIREDILRDYKGVRIRLGDGGSPLYHAWVPEYQSGRGWPDSI